MATDQEVTDARLRIDDKTDLLTALTQLSDIIGGTGEIVLFVERDGVQFNFSRLKSILESGNANEDAMITAVESATTTAIGPDEVTAGTIRKALRDLITLHEADITAT